MKKSKFNLLYEEIMDYCKDTKTEITETAAKGLPIEVKDAIAKFIYDYLVQEKSFIDCLGSWETYSELIQAGKQWKKDKYLREHYSCPSDHFNEFKQAASYDKATNTVTMSDIADIDDIWNLAWNDEAKVQKIIEELNENWNNINGINFVWN